MSDVNKTLGYLSRQKLARLSEKLKERAVKAAPQKMAVVPIGLRLAHFLSHN